MGFNLVRCVNGHYFDSAQFKVCPQCGAGYIDRNAVTEIVQTVYGPPPFGGSPFPAVLKFKIARCNNGHYYDKAKNGSCPVCGSSEPYPDEKAKDENAAEIRRLKEKLADTETAIEYYNGQIEELKKRIGDLQLERIKLLVEEN